MNSKQNIVRKLKGSLSTLHTNPMKVRSYSCNMYAHPIYQQIINCLNLGANALVQSPTGTGKTLSLLCSTLSWLHSRQSSNGQVNRRVIYTSRTHSQLKQVISELVRSGFEVKLSVLASRDHTCLNGDLKQLQGKSKELQCRLRTKKNSNLFCKYFHHQEYFDKMKTKGTIMDLEDLGMKGKTQGFCPFFYQKSIKNIANLILMPYNYLFDDYSEELAALVNNSIVVFDQAHNIPSICQQTKQYTITCSILARALQQLGELRQLNLNERKSTKPVSEQQGNASRMKSTAEDIQLHASYVSVIHSHLQTLALSNSGSLMDGTQYLKLLESATKQGQFGCINKNLGKLIATGVCLRADILYRPFWAIESWIGFLQKVSQIYDQRLQPEQKEQDCYRCQVDQIGSDIKLSFICLDPKAGFQKIIKLKPYSIILTSGTLSPLNSLPMELEVEFNKPLACPHILTKQQVNGCILTHGPNKHKINFSYENRDDKMLYKELGNILLDIVSMTDNGVIVFVTSYKMMEKVKIQLTDNGLLSQIYAKKNIYFQKKNSADFKITLQQYLKDAGKIKGALLLALARGKISQGLDFSDQKCRAVVMVGVPYPNSSDIKIKSKMAYLDEKSKIKKSMNGNQWYICETIRCVNQSIGRIVRNKKDYGSIYLLDERFKKTEILGQISSWARECMKVVTDYEDFKFKVGLFRKYFSEKNREEQEADIFFKSTRGVTLGNKIEHNFKLIPGSISVSSSSVKNIPGSISVSSSSVKNPGKSPGSNVTTAIDPSKMHQDFREKYKSEMSEQKNKKQEAKPSREQIIFGNRGKKMPVASVAVRQCPVCRLQRRLLKNTECVHELCEECWDIWLKKDLRCPLCRVRVRQKYLIRD